MKHLKTVKGLACNKARARVWVDGMDLIEWGFERRAPITIELCEDHICIALDDAGKRIVAGRTKGGKDLPILDIGMPMEQRAAMFGGAERLDVFVEQGRMVIKGAA